MNKMSIKINILRTILIILIIGTFGVIFGFSSQNSEKSSSVSRRVTEIITNGIESIQEKPKEEKEIILSEIESIIRKIAHFSIYAVVGILLMSLFETYKLKEFNKLSYSLILSVVYATSDELHQCFTPGRGPAITDVMIDTMGALVGILLVILCKKILIKIRKSKVKVVD